MSAIPASGSLWDQAAKEASAAGRVVTTVEARSMDKVAAAVAVLLVVAQPEEKEEEEEEKEEEEVLAAGFGAVCIQSQRSKASLMMSVHRCSSRFDISAPIHWQKMTRGLSHSCTADCSRSCTPVF